MVRSVSFLLLTFGVAVVFLFDSGMTGATRRTSRINYLNFHEIPEYEILFWPSPLRGKTSRLQKDETFSINNTTEINNSYVRKKITEDEKNTVQERIGLKASQEVIIPITVHPVTATKSSIEISAIALTIKPKTTTRKSTVVTEKITAKPLTTTAKPLTTLKTKPLRITQPVNNASKGSSTTLRPTLKPNTTKKGQNSNRNTTVSAQIPVQSVTVKPLESPTKPTKPKPPQSSGPCSCVVGVCTCCSGPLLGLLSQKACVKVNYIPEDFAFDYSLMLNNRVLYQNKVSGKNPRPACIGIPGFNRVKMCAKFSNIYFAGRNVHFCLGLEGRWEYEELFNMPFDCVRMGAQGFAIVKPEEGGGILVPGGFDSVIDAGGDDIGEYDENVLRNWFEY